MADYYNYNNVSVKVNGSGILANSASFSFSPTLSKDNRINKIGGDSYVADGPLAGSMSLNYYVDASSGDPFYMSETNTPKPSDGAALRFIRILLRKFSPV